MKKIIRLLSACMIAGVFVVSMTSSAFFKGWRAGEADWEYVQIPENYSYNTAFKTVQEVLSEKFDMAIEDQEERIIRTAWGFDRSLIGTPDKNTRIRVTVKFSSNGKRLSVKTEVQLLVAHHWKDGYCEEYSRKICKELENAL